MATIKAEQPKQLYKPEWFPSVGRKYGLFLAIVSLTSLVTATLLAFASLAHQEAQLSRFDNDKDTDAEGGQDENMEVIKRAFDESSADQQNAPMEYMASTNVTLLCRFSARYRVGIYPYGVCTHFIYSSVPSKANQQDEGVLYNYDHDSFKKFLHIRELAPESRLLLAVEVEAMLDTGRPDERLASDARLWLGRSGVDGLYLSGINLLPRKVARITDIVTALRKSFKRNYLLTIGIDRKQSVAEKDLLKLLRMADIASFKTFPLLHTDDYTTMTNPYSKYDNSSYGEFLDSAVKKLAELAARSRKSRVCFTLALGGNQFTLRDSAHHGLGASATHAREASYSEICRRNWNDVQYDDSAKGYYACSGTTWVAYDTEETIAEKVRLALRSYPSFCVMLVRVEKDDFRGICSEKHFPLAQSVRHAMRHFGNNKRFA